MAQPTKLQIKEWVKALRSGKYKQTQNSLQDEKGFCCLGVACNQFIHPSALNYEEGLIKGGLPEDQPASPPWLKHISYDFKNKAGVDLVTLNDIGLTTFEHAFAVFKNEESDRFLPKLDRFTFDEIADLLELVYIHDALNE